MTIQEYFQLDYLFPHVKYEYQDGMIRLMAGGSGAHSIISGNMYIELRLHFRSGPCSVFNSDMRVQVTEDAYFFPDVTLACDVADRQRDTTRICSPRIVVEVLSSSTEKIDRTDKLRAYQACPTIQEIVLIDQFRLYVEVYRRIEEDSTEWSKACYEAGQEVALESVDVYIPMEEIYRGINFDKMLLE
jgi:Uma2 family endonuclease